MSPEELCYRLRAIAAYIDNGPNPNSDVVIKHLETTVKMLPGNQTAGKVNRFVNTEYTTTMKGLDALIDHLSKAAKTLNPQDQSKADLERRIADFQGMKASLIDQFNLLGNIDI